jgi:hypothetical protein
MNPTEAKYKQWSDDVAELAVDALLHAQLIPEDKFDDASSIVAEEIFVRLILGDLPDSKPLLDSNVQEDR